MRHAAPTASIDRKLNRAGQLIFAGIAYAIAGLATGLIAFGAALTTIGARGLNCTQPRVVTGPHEAIIRRGRRPSGTRVTLTRRAITWCATGGGAHRKGTSRHATATQIAHIIEVGWR